MPFYSMTLSDDDADSVHTFTITSGNTTALSVCAVFQFTSVYFAMDRTSANLAFVCVAALLYCWSSVWGSGLRGLTHACVAQLNANSGEMSTLLQLYYIFQPQYPLGAFGLES
jgi:hypothetical protein